MATMMRETSAVLEDLDKSATLFLRDIQAEFLHSLPAQIREMEELWESAMREPGRNEALECLHRRAHSLRGEGATFGFSWVSNAAGRLENVLQPLAVEEQARSPAPIPAERAREVERLLGDLARAALRYDARHLPELPSRFSRQPSKPVPGAEKLVFVVDDDRDLAKAVAMQLRHYGYLVEVFTNLDGVAAAIAAQAPAAVVMDVVLPEGKLAGAEFIAMLRQTRGEELRVVFISMRRDLEARLHACRAGGDAYFAKPFDVGALAERLDQLTGRQPEQPYEILVVDDDREIALLYARTLKNAGMMVTLLTDPLAVLEQLDHLRPDLILLDVYMPGCSGPELAVVLRQHESFLSIPIVFLSSETDLENQLAALNLGGDEFLTKPLEPRHLIDTVRARARRGRQLGSMISRDALTGLLNHSRQREQLQIELKRAEREGHPVTFAMLDLDNFKTINDTHGHRAGDRVLRSLAGMLTQRLRQTDFIARYGGDELAIILPSTSPREARRLLEDVVTSFAQLGHLSGEQRFSATLSCGLASFPRYPSPELLTEATDQALYEAKRLGKGRVVLRD